MKHKLWMFLALLASVATGPGVRAVDSTIEKLDPKKIKFLMKEAEARHRVALAKEIEDLYQKYKQYMDNIFSKEKSVAEKAKNKIDEYFKILENQKNQPRSQEVEKANKELLDAILKGEPLETLTPYLEKADRYGKNQALIQGLVLGGKDPLLKKRSARFSGRCSDENIYLQNIMSSTQNELKELWNYDPFVMDILMYNDVTDTESNPFAVERYLDFPLNQSILEHAAVSMSRINGVNFLNYLQEKINKGLLSLDPSIVQILNGKKDFIEEFDKKIEDEKPLKREDNNFSIFDEE